MSGDSAESRTWGRRFFASIPCPVFVSIYVVVYHLVPFSFLVYTAW